MACRGRPVRRSSRCRASYTCSRSSYCRRGCRNSWATRLSATQRRRRAERTCRRAKCSSSRRCECQAKWARASRGRSWASRRRTSGGSWQATASAGATHRGRCCGRATSKASGCRSKWTRSSSSCSSQGSGRYLGCSSAWTTHVHRPTTRSRPRSRTGRSTGRTARCSTQGRSSSSH